jgi:hypothetical protein
MRSEHQDGHDPPGCIGCGWGQRCTLSSAMPRVAEARWRAGIVLTERPESAPPPRPDVQSGRPVRRNQLGAMVAVEIRGGNRSQRFGAANHIRGLRRRQPHTHDRRLVRGEGDVIAMAIAVKVCGQRPLMCVGARDDQERTQARQPEGTTHGRRHAGHAIYEVYAGP